MTPWMSFAVQSRSRVIAGLPRNLSKETYAISGEGSAQRLQTACPTFSMGSGSGGWATLLQPRHCGLDPQSI